MEVRLETEAPLSNIKLEQDLGYSDNYDASIQSGTPSYDEDGYLHNADKDSISAKVQPLCRLQYSDKFIAVCNGQNTALVGV